MDDFVDKSNQILLEKLEALYKASHRGVAPKLNQNELNLLLELKNNLQKNEVNYVEIDPMIRMLRIDVESQLKAVIGSQQWDEADNLTKEQLIWISFIREYGMSPEYLAKFINKNDKK